MTWIPYTPEPLNLSDPSDKRLFHFLNSSSENSIELWGYPDDEGIWMNGGRPGARMAPDIIRQYLFKMTPDSFSWKSLSDHGNLSLETNLRSRHQQALERARLSTASGKNWISFGGGHDYGYSDAAGFIEGLGASGKKPIILNFDAHLDVRPNQKGDNSGTPFYRLLSRQDLQFSLYEIGIQPQCNSINHRAWALDHGAKVLDLSTIQERGLTSSLQTLLSGEALGSPLFLSLDIDSFSAQAAPGCSQSWATGLGVTEFFSAFEWLHHQFGFQALGIYEVSPPLDIQNQTSKLAALIAYHFLRIKNAN